MKKALILLLVGLGGLAGFARAADLIENMDGRHVSDLNGHWQIIVDPYETGVLTFF